MFLYYMLGNLGLFSFVLGIFYFIVMPVWIIVLHNKVKRLERGVRPAVASPQPMTPRPVTSAPVQQVPRPAPTPKKTAGPSFEEKVGGHWFQWIGIAALVIALLFFLKWSFDNGWIGPAGRTLIGYVLSGGAILAGDRMRKRYGPWSLAFTGGGALGCYIVTWIALHTYNLFPPTMGFAIYILTTAVTCLLAGYYGAIALAAFGIVGGFLTPILTGSEGSTLSLLLYILILDIGIFALSHARQWRVLNALGLFGTAVYEIVALSDYAFDRMYGLAFLAAFFVIYALVPYYYNFLQQKKSNTGDVLLLLGNALVHFVLILVWLQRTPGLREQYDAVVSLAFAVIFLFFSSEIYRRNKLDTPLVLCCLALTTFFTSLAIPLQLGNIWVPLAWSIEGAFLLWMGLLLKDARIQRLAWPVMIAAYFWYLFVTPTWDQYGMGPSIVFYQSGFYLFLVWAALFVGMGWIGIGRDDRKQSSLLPMMFTGLAVLTIAFCMNLFMEPASSLTTLQRFIQAVGLIGGGYLVLIQAGIRWNALDANERSRFSALGVAVQIVTLIYLTDEFVRAVNDGVIFASFERQWQVLQVGISILWAVYGVVVLVVGIYRNWKPLRLFGMIVLLIATGKLTLIDLFSLGTGYRVIGFTILGALLVAASILYQRKKEALKSFFVS